jgi:acyl-CoA reductase-like NAD-dependent aldehyde dehydrogenase
MDEIPFNDVAVAQALERELAQLRAAQDGEPYPAWEVRAARLRALEQMVITERGRIAEAIDADFGHRSVHETEMLEVFPSLEGLRHALRHGHGWMRERRASVSMWFRPGSAAVLPQPLGVVGIIVPWNYPLYLLVGPLTSALVAGNRAMVKLSEYAPRFGALMAELLPRALGAEVVRVVNGGPDVAARFSALPFDHLLFTGSTSVGRRVMAAAAQHLVPVTLELGGKSPALVTADTCGRESRFRHAVERIIAGKVVNAGQTCIAPDYVLMPRAHMQRFIAIARQVLARQYPQGAAGADYSGVATQPHFLRLHGMLEQASAGGAQAEALMAPAQAGQRKMPLTVVTGCPEDARLMQEEIFGPLLPLVACETVEEAVAYVNRRPRPLALYLFDDAGATQRKVLQDVVAGGVSVNETLMHIAQDDLPFGGVGDSGQGHYHGKYGFDTMSKLKPIFRQARFNGMGLLSPPYGQLFKRMMQLMIRG